MLSHMCVHNRPAQDRHEYPVQLTSGEAVRWYNIIMCSPYSSIFPMEIQAKAKIGLVCQALYTQCYAHPHIGDHLPISQHPNALAEDQLSASGMITFPLAEYCFLLAETQISTSGTVLSTSGQLAIRQRRGRNCVRTALKKCTPHIIPIDAGGVYWDHDKISVTSIAN